MTLDELLTICDALPTLPPPPGCTWTPWTITHQGTIQRRVRMKIGSDKITYADAILHPLDIERQIENLDSLATFTQEVACANLMKVIIHEATA